MIQQPRQAIEAIQHALEKTASSELAALYLYGSIVKEKYIPGLSDINLLAVVKEGTNIHQIRDALRPIWLEHSHAIRQMPLIATPASLQRHLQLFPILAAHLVHYGRLLAGESLEINAQPITLAERLSMMAQTSQAASESLAPALQSESDQKTAVEKLFRLANFLGIDKNSETDSPLETVAAVQAHLARLLTGHPSLCWQGPAPTGAPPMVDSLVAIYEMQDRVILLLPDWTPERIEANILNTDWTAVSESLEGQYKGLQITTPSLLRLIYKYDKAADHFFQNYQHAWGQTPLASLEVPHWLVYRDLARLPTIMEIKSLPHAYFIASDDQLDMLIHDFQNRLLNNQLREELMIRLDNRERGKRPPTLPDRQSPSHVRIDAIFNQFNWWANHYSTIMHHKKNNPP